MVLLLLALSFNNNASPRGSNSFAGLFLITAIVLLQFQVFAKSWLR